MEQILTSKSAGMTVIKEYEEFERFHQAINGEHHCGSHVKMKGKRFDVNDMNFSFVEEARILPQQYFCFCRRAVSKAAKEFHALGIVSSFHF